MASLDLQRLWKLAQIDAALLDVRNKAASLDPGKVLRSQVESLKAQDSDVGGHARAMQQEVVDLELQLKSINEKVKRIDKEIYGGKVVSSREIETLEKEKLSLAKQKDGIDERLLGIYEELPGVKAASEKILVELEAKRKELVEANKRALAQKGDLEREFARLNKLRPEAAKIVNPSLLAKYESIRNRQHGIGMVGISRKNACEGCGMNLPERTIQMLKDDKMATCEACHRLLYYTEGVV